MDPKRYCQRVFNDLLVLEVPPEQMPRWLQAMSVLCYTLRLCDQGQGSIAVDLAKFTEARWEFDRDEKDSD